MGRDKQAEEITGELWFEGGCVKNRSRFFGDWELPIEKLRIVGEATNDLGPFVDDWMLIFATDSSGWREASFYATIHTGFVRRLGAELGAELTPALAASTTFDSRILWPPHLAGGPVFQYDDAPPRNMWERILWKLVGPMRNVQRFTPEVQSYLTSIATARRREGPTDSPAI